jgi:hypothetical protein
MRSFHFQQKTETVQEPTSVTIRGFGAPKYRATQ